MRVLKHESLKKHTSFKIGGEAAVFVEPGNAAELQKLLPYLKKEGMPYRILGNGSNVLVSDHGVEELIIHIGKELSRMEILKGTEKVTVRDQELLRDKKKPLIFTIFEAEAGASLAQAGKYLQKHGYSGFEELSGIPGSVGGAVVMNAGAYGREVKDILLSATVLDKKGEALILSGEELELSYRHSIIEKKGYVVLSARFIVEYGDAETVRERMAELQKKRREKQPFRYPSAGSTFKRPEGHFAGQLIEEAGLRGMKVGDAQVSEKHCGFVINRGNAAAKDVMLLIRKIQKAVKKQSGVTLQPEVKLWGNF